MKKTCLLFLLLTAFPFCISAQVDNQALTREPVLPDSASGSLFLTVDHLFFFRNNEYYNPFADGYTLLGNQFSPALNYVPADGLVLTAGFLLKQDFGKPGFGRVLPVLGFGLEKLGMKSWLGSYRGTLGHRLPQPVYAFERSLSDPLEYGYQMVMEREHLFLDSWLHWDQMIERYDPEQEKIWAGLNMQWTPALTDRLRLEFPFMLTAFHHGGQIDTSGLAVYTLWNLGTGVGMRYSGPAAYFLQGAGVEMQYLLSSQGSSGGINPFSRGWGWYLNAEVNTRYLDLMLSYWKGHLFYAEFGDPLFSSVSRKLNREGYTEPDRELIFLRLMKDFRIAGNLWLSLRLEPFWDSRHGLDFSHGVYLHYTDVFKLWKGGVPGP